MKSAIEFERDIERYLKSKLPDIPEHTVMEIAAYVTDRTAIFMIDTTKDINRPTTYRRSPTVSYKSYYNRHRKCEVEDIIFETREEAEKTIKQLNSLIQDYRYVSVADLYDLVALTSNYEQTHFGWTKTFDVDGCLMELPEGWKIVLPKPEEVDI